MARRRTVRGTPFQRGRAVSDLLYGWTLDYLRARANEDASTRMATSIADERHDERLRDAADDYDLDAGEMRTLRSVRTPPPTSVEETLKTLSLPTTAARREPILQRAALQIAQQNDRGWPRAELREEAAPRPAPARRVSAQQAASQRIRERIVEGGSKYEFDLPPSAKTKAEFAKKYPPGSKCLKLPQEGGEFRYTICGEVLKADPETGREERIVRFDIVAVDAKDDFVGTVGASLKDIKAPIGKNSYKVGWADVKDIDYAERLKPESERTKPSGLGTRMYERALRAVCDVGQAYAVTSDNTRSEFSEAFWRKQLAKGRATCEGDGKESKYFKAPLIEAAASFEMLPQTWEAEWLKKNRGQRPTTEMREAWENRAADAFEQYREGLPKRRTDEWGAWPCDFYSLKCSKRPDSLDGLRYQIRSRSKRR
jgi:hypothetical protein